MNKVPSEFQLFLKQLGFVISLPYRLFRILTKKEKWSSLLAPLKDVWHYALAPKATLSIMAVIVVCFIASMFFDVSSFIHTPTDLFEYKWYTILTTSFFHANLAHLTGNLLGLWVFGRVVERKLGHAKTVVIYFGATILAITLASLIHYYILGDNTGGLGASGGIMGLVAIAILIDPFYMTFDFGLPIPVMVYGWLALVADITGIINPVEDGIGHFAHLAGFFSVGLLGYFLSKKDRNKLKRGLWFNMLSLFLATLLYFFLSQIF